MKKFTLIVFSLVLFFLLSGCVLLRKSAETGARVEIVKNQWITLPRPAALGFDLNAMQLLTATYHINHSIKSYSSQVQVEVNQQHIVLVALSGFGSELFSLKYDGTNLQSSSLPMPNAEMGVKQTLTDFILSYAPSSLIHALLKNTNITLQVKSHQRLFIQHHKVIIQIDYQTDNRFKGKVVLHNKLFNYTVAINTISYKLNNYRPDSPQVGE